MTTKTIETLIEDIHELIGSGHNVPEEDIEAFGTRLAKTITERLFRKNEERNTLRMSNLGTPCERKLWYTVSDDHDGEELPPAARIKFLFGDILEDLLLFLAEQSGHEVRGRQDELNIAGVVGHRDAIIDNVLVDVKSASSLSYKKFAKHELGGNDPFGYIDQLNAYHYATVQSDAEVDTERFAFFVIDKQLGHICLDLHVPNGVNYNELVEHKRRIIDSPVPPQRAYFDEPDGKSGNRKLPTPCGYCAYKHSCWPNLRTFLYSNGPRYLTTVIKQPEVPEVRDQEDGFQE